MRRNNIKVIAIGGMIGVGKSTLVNGVLEKIPNSEVVYEIDPDDELTKQMLGFHHGSKTPTATTLFQIHFLTQCFLNHRNSMFKLDPSVKLVCLDRTILEHYLFTRHYKSIDIDVFNNMWWPAWNKYVAKLKEYNQLPDMYYLLDASIPILFERLFERGRLEEVQNYQQMISSFVRLSALYMTKMKSILGTLDVKYKIINTDNLNQDEVFEIVRKDIKNNFKD